MARFLRTGVRAAAAAVGEKRRAGGEDCGPTRTGLARVGERVPEAEAQAADQSHGRDGGVCPPVQVAEAVEPLEGRVSGTLHSSWAPPSVGLPMAAVARRDTSEPWPGFTDVNSIVLTVLVEEPPGASLENLRARTPQFQST